MAAQRHARGRQGVSHRDQGTVDDAGRRRDPQSDVTLRQVLDLYACIRSVRYFAGTPAPVTHPERMNVVIFRENTEDVYAGIEWAKGTPEARKIIEFLEKEMGKRVRPDSGIGIKPISETGSKRLVRQAIQI